MKIARWRGLYYTLREKNLLLLSYGKEYERTDSFPFDYELNLKEYDRRNSFPFDYEANWMEYDRRKSFPLDSV